MKPTFNYDDIFPDRWLHAEDLQGKAVTLTITAAYQEDLRLPGGSVETCGILSFAKTKKEYVLNKSNAMVLRELWGDQSGEWGGHRIVLEAVPDTSGKSASGFRIVFTGSPDLTASVTVKQPQNKTRVIRATGKGAAPVASVAPVVVDEDPGEVDEGLPAEEAASSTGIGQNGDAGTSGGTDASGAETEDSGGYWPDADAESPDAAGAAAFIATQEQSHVDRFPDSHKEQPGGITTQQMRALNVQWRKLADAGWSDEQLRALLLRETGKLSRKALTIAEASAAVKALAMEVQDLGSEATA